MIKFKHDGPWSRNAIFMAQAGSAAYGTKTPESDTDYRGVFLADEQHIFGLQNVESYAEEQPIDLQCYELRHYVRLCLKGSPLQLEMLFYPDAVISNKTDYWDRLLTIRRSFLGKHLKKTLGGFAQGDIKRIRGNLTQKCGAKGKALIQKYGYNTKHAMSSMRLLKMAELLWTTGELVVSLPEALRAELIDVKNGKYSRDDFLSLIEDEDKRIFSLADKSDLPDKPDTKLAQQTVIEIYKDFFAK